MIVTPTPDAAPPIEHADEFASESAAPIAVSEAATAGRPSPHEVPTRSSPRPTRVLPDTGVEPQHQRPDEERPVLPERPRRGTAEATAVLYRSKPVAGALSGQGEPDRGREGPHPGRVLPLPPSQGGASLTDDDPGHKKTLPNLADTEQRIGLAQLATPVALLSLPGERPFSPTATRAGRYQMGELLGEGGMGRVIAVKDVDLGRVVALKTLREEQKSNPAYLQALVFEARLTGQLEHPNIVPVHELGSLPDGTPYYTMKLVGDLSLQDVLRQLREKRPLALKHYTRNRLLQYFRGICMAVEYAHARGVIHRDLKPGNVLIGDYGEVQILDWGVARVLPHDGRPSYFAGRIEEPGVVIGTPHYMSPEQARGDTHLVDARSDVYSLGVMLYQLLTHTLPFDTTSTVEQLDALLSEEVTPPSVRAPGMDISPELERICMKALAARRADRYPSARALWEDIESYLEGERERERLRELADSQVADGERAAERFYRASEELIVLDSEVQKDEQAARHLDPLEVKKAAWERKLLAEEKRMVEARLFAEAVLGFQRALAYVPGHVAARERLVELYRHRAQIARLRGEVTELILYSDLARAVAPTVPTDSGRIHVRTYPEGASLRILELTADGPIEAASGQAPIVDLRLKPGSYLVCATLPGHAERRETVVVEPGAYEPVLLSLTPWDSALPIVARGDDLTAMREAFTAVMAERRIGSMMITGGAGLGKRKLLDEFGEWLDRLPQVVVYGAVRLEPIHRHVPFFAITELLAHRAGLVRFDPPEVAQAKILDMVRRPYLEGPHGELPLSAVLEGRLRRQAERISTLPAFRARGSETAEVEQSREHTIEVFEAVASYLRKLCESTPVVLAFRGADNLDRLSRDLLFFVGERLHDVPLFCVMFAREDSLQLRCDQTLRLLPLDHDRIRQQLALLLRGPATEDALELVARLSEGNAFQVAEAVRLLARRGHLRHDGRQWRLSSQAAAELEARTIEDLFAESLTGLPPLAREVLARASVQGPSFWAEALVGVDGGTQGLTPQAVDDALELLLSQEVVTRKATSRFPGTHEFGFRHDALQRRIVRGLDEALRVRAHRDFAHWVLAAGSSGLPDLALAALHAERGDDLELALRLRGELALEAARWERPERHLHEAPAGPAWFDWPENLASALFDG